jgi:hypothetical protein
MAQVPMRDRERFFLRLTLLHRRGATSWADLKTVDGVPYPTYEETAVAMGIADDDKEWQFCLEEVYMFNAQPDVMVMVNNSAKNQLIIMSYA